VLRDTPSPFTLSAAQRAALTDNDSASSHVYRQVMNIMEKGSCPSCWLLQGTCMCSWSKSFDIPHRILVLMHPKGCN
jgi:DTW domain-containing protein YfiP